MSAYQRSLVKQQKKFYRSYYRGFVFASLISVTLSIVLCAMIFYVYIGQAPIDYYASNTAGFITPITAMAEPNQADTYLLKPDPPEEVHIKELDVE